VNHDALFKKLLKNRSVLRAFFEEFFANTAAFMDFDSIEYVDKERFTLEGKKRTGDLLIKTKFRGEPACFLIHLEHQAQFVPDLGWRILEYLVLDQREYGLPVYPIAVLSHDETIPETSFSLVSEFPNKRVLQFDFDVLDLRHLEADVYVRRHNTAALALAARMKIRAEDKIRIVADFFSSLATAETGDREKELVSGFFSAYQPLDEKEDLKLNEQLGKLKSEEKEKVMRLTNPFIERGKREGMREGQVEIVLSQIQCRVGDLPSAQEKKIRKLDLNQIGVLGKSLLDFKSRADLTRWLKQNAS
jgi:hypothetical protein